MLHSTTLALLLGSAVGILRAPAHHGFPSLGLLRPGLHARRVSSPETAQDKFHHTQHFSAERSSNEDGRQNAARRRSSLELDIELDLRLARVCPGVERATARAGFACPRALSDGENALVVATQAGVGALHPTSHAPFELIVDVHGSAPSVLDYPVARRPFPAPRGPPDRALGHQTRPYRHGHQHPHDLHPVAEAMLSLILGIWLALALARPLARSEHRRLHRYDLSPAQVRARDKLGHGYVRHHPRPPHENASLALPDVFDWNAEYAIPGIRCGRRTDTCHVAHFTVHGLLVVLSIALIALEWLRATRRAAARITTVLHIIFTLLTVFSALISVVRALNMNYKPECGYTESNALAYAAFDVALRALLVLAAYMATLQSSAGGQPRAARQPPPSPPPPPPPPPPVHACPARVTGNASQPLGLLDMPGDVLQRIQQQVYSAAWTEAAVRKGYGSDSMGTSTGLCAAMAGRDAVHVYDLALGRRWYMTSTLARVCRPRDPDPDSQHPAGTWISGGLAQCICKLPCHSWPAATPSDDCFGLCDDASGDVVLDGNAPTLLAAVSNVGAEMPMRIIARLMCPTCLTAAATTSHWRQYVASCDTCAILADARDGLLAHPDTPNALQNALVMPWWCPRDATACDCSDDDEAVHADAASDYDPTLCSVCGVGYDGFCLHPQCPCFNVDMDVSIPNSYEQALSSSHARYWREADGWTTPPPSGGDSDDDEPPPPPGACRCPVARMRRMRCTTTMPIGANGLSQPCCSREHPYECLCTCPACTYEPGEPVACFPCAIDCDQVAARPVVRACVGRVRSPPRDTGPNGTTPNDAPAGAAAGDADDGPPTTRPRHGTHTGTPCAAFAFAHGHAPSLQAANGASPSARATDCPAPADYDTLELTAAEIQAIVEGDNPEPRARAALHADEQGYSVELEDEARAALARAVARGAARSPVDPLEPRRGAGGRAQTPGGSSITRAFDDMTVAMAAAAPSHFTLPAELHALADGAHGLPHAASDVSSSSTDDSHSQVRGPCLCPFAAGHGPCTNIHPLEPNGLTCLCRERVGPPEHPVYRCNCPCPACDAGAGRLPSNAGGSAPSGASGGSGRGRGRGRRPRHPRPGHGGWLHHPTPPQSAPPSPVGRGRTHHVPPADSSPHVARGVPIAVAPARRPPPPRWLPHRRLRELAPLLDLLRQHARTLAILASFAVSRAASDDSTYSSRPPHFSGQRVDWTAFTIAFAAWVAWKLTDCATLIDTPPEAPPGAAPAPTFDGAGGITNQADITAAVDAAAGYSTRNKRLYGALVSALPAWLATSLHMNTRNDGVASYTRLEDQFGSNDRNDLASAISRVGGRYIDSRAEISEADMRHQFDAMQVANADIVRSGGTAFTDAVLMVNFDNALPNAYANMRHLVRRANHATFTAHFADYLSLVKADVDARAAHAPAHAYAAAFIPHHGSRGRGGGPPAGGAGLGKGKGRGKGGRGSGPSGGRGGGGGAGRDLSGMRCLRCGGLGHGIMTCTAAPRQCPHCARHGDHHPKYCPHGPDNAARSELSNNARRRVDGDAGGPVARAAAAVANGDYGAAVTADQLLPPPSDDGATAYIAAVRGYIAASHAPRACVAVPSELRAICPSATMVNMYVDSMASMVILRRAPPGFRVTNSAPGFSIETLDGSTRVQAVGDVTMYVLNNDDTRSWSSYLLRGVLIAPDADVDLYSTRVMRDQHAAVHNFDAAPLSITVGNTAHHFDDDGSAFILAAAFGPPPRNAPMERVGRTLALPATAALPTATVAADDGRIAAPATPPRSSVSQQLLWQRLGFPHPASWRYVTTVTASHGQPPNATLSSTLAARDAVMRGRARLLPFLSSPVDKTLPPPGAVIYLDFCGPMVASHPHKFTCYSGAICAGSGYGRAFPCHRMTADVARSTYDAFVADLSSRMGLPVLIKPQLVVSDQGSAYVAHNFREFLAARQTMHRLAPTYTPQANALVERMWGVTFGTARVLLAAARLPPTFHPFAVQTARWLHNRLPTPSRANVSPYYMLTRQPADLTYLRAFGSLCHYTVPKPRRDGDKHLSDRGAAGLYLGPSEESPASVVYVLSSHTVAVTRNLICYEDRFPGVTGQSYDWFPQLSEEGVTAAQPPAQLPAQTTQPTQPAPPQPTPPTPPTPTEPPTTPANAPSPPVLPTPRSAQEGASPQEGVELPSPHTAASPRHQETMPPPFNLPTVEADTTEHPLADDPSSVHYRRQHPTRSRAPPSDPTFNISDLSTKKYGAAATFHDPLRSDVGMTITTFLAMTAFITSPIAAYALESTADISTFADGTAPLAMRVNVQPTADYGDISIPNSYKQALSSTHAQYWKEAIAKELEGLISTGTWSTVARSSIPKGANVMRCHYIFTVKRKQSGEVERFKCRLVANGDSQRHGQDFDRVFSTVVKMSTVRLVIAIAAARDYNLSSIDVRQAYLQATLDEEMYMMVPPGLPQYNSSGEPNVLRLHRSLYGLKQAGREWNKLLVAFLIEWGFIQSKIDVCLFLYALGKSILWLLVWVDDVIQADNDSNLRDRFVADLGKRFPTEDKGRLEYVLGVQVTRARDKRKIELSQELYVNDLLGRHDDLLAAGHSRRYTSPMDDKVNLSIEHSPTAGSAEAEEMKPRRQAYMSIVGGLLWLANVTRFEIAYAASQLARFVSNPGELHFAAAIRVLLYLKTTVARRLVFSPRVDGERPFETYVDSNWSVKFSSSGALFFYNGCLIAWFSKVQRSVSFSSAEAELFGAIMAGREAVFFRELLTDLGITPSGPTHIFSDSKSCVELSYDPVSFKKTKHILRAAEGLRDYVARLVVVLIHLPGKVNMADILTKNQASSVFNELMIAYDAYVAAT